MADDTEWTPKQDMSLLCRVCANQHDYLIPIFQGEGLDHDMPTKMDKHLPIKVRESDKLPTQMCYQCASTIIAWSELHTNCLAADKKLKGMLRINEKKMGVVDTADDDAGSDHYEDAYDDGGGGGDDDDEDFEKEIKQLISDAGVELGSKTAKASKRPSRAAATRKRKSEVTITPVKRETKKPKTEPSASKSSTALLKPKEEVVSNEDRSHVWSCCMCSASFVSCESLNIHVWWHQSVNLEKREDYGEQIRTNTNRDSLYCFNCLNTLSSHTVEVCGTSFGFVCDGCDQIFTEKFALDYHEKIEHLNISNLTWYACRECCNVLYKCKEDIVKHLEKVHRETNLDVSKYIVKTIQDITFPCVECGKNCVLSKFCNQHKATRSHPVATDNNKTCSDFHGSHECQVCQLILANCHKLWAHMFKDHIDKVDEFKCNLCTAPDTVMNFRYAPVVVYHMKKSHGFKLFLTTEMSNLTRMSQISIDEVTMYKCFECPVMVSQFKYLRNHMLLHCNVKKESTGSSGSIHICELCNKRYVNKRVLDIHRASVHENRRPYKCNVCGVDFKTKGSLDTHVEIHTGEKNHVCTICGAAFTQRAGLNMHKFSHSEKRFVCTYCGKMFKNPNHLKSHMNLHTGERIYVCEVCGREFRSRNAWRGHMAVHSTERPYICEYCNASFKARKHLVQHHKTHTKNS